ncbi:MAG: hypothetical protein AVDCRST_MAG43-643, partial [uncultured Thermomicrobiales bacterium]
CLLSVGSGRGTPVTGGQEVVRWRSASSPCHPKAKRWASSARVRSTRRCF